MKSAFARMRHYVRRDGVRTTARRIARRLRVELGLAPDHVDRRRVLLSRWLFREFNGIVRYGPMAGLQLRDDLYWANGDAAPMLLGIYEQEVLDALRLASSTHHIVVNLGAADGYYGVGLVKSGLFREAYCFELTAAGRGAIAALAAANHLESRVHVFGAANADFPALLKEENLTLDDAVVLCDIEGAEFDTFTDTTLAALRRSIIIIEIHDFLREDGAGQLLALKDRARAVFSVSEFRMGARDLSVFPECRKLNDSDRWLLASEGRGELMTWLRLDPK